MAWLDYDGLLYFWQKIKAKLNDKVDKVEGKGLSSNDFTAAEKNKLAGIGLVQTIILTRPLLAINIFRLAVSLVRF